MTPQVRKARGAYRLIQAARNMAPTEQGKDRIEQVEVNSNGYAEPGYGDESSVIALCNWNGVDQDAHVKVPLTGGTFRTRVKDDTIERLSASLERYGVAIEWSDEWSSCEDCGKLVRTSGDSYSWTPSYAILNDCELLCHECIAADPSEYLESLEGNDGNAETLDLNLAEHGYVELEDGFEHGWHPGQDASPKSIGKALGDAGVTRYLFRIDDQGQFDTRFSVWVHESELEDRTLDDLRDAIDGKTNGPSPSEAAKRFLAGASAALKAHEGKS